MKPFTIEQSAHGPAILVQKGKEITDSIEVPHTEPDQRWNAVIGEGAKATMCERDIRDSEIIVEAGAQLDLISLQADVHPGDEITKNIILHDNAIVRVFTGLFNTANVKIVGMLEGNKSVFENHIMYVGSSKQQIKMLLNSEHVGKETMARTLVRGVAFEQAHCDFAGSINIHQTGSGTDGHLEHEGLLLSQKARIDALPGLEIGTDDVKAAHSSAIHYIRPEQLFYLHTRGIDTPTAKQMIVAGFLETMLATVREEVMLKEIHTLVEQKKELLTQTS